MKMNKLNKAVLKLWYIRAAILALALVGAEKRDIYFFTEQYKICRKLISD